MGTNLDESLASLQLSVNSNHSLSNGRMCNSNYGRTNSINTDFNQHQYVPGTINPMLTSEFGNERSCELVRFSFSSPGFLTAVKLERTASLHPHNSRTAPTLQLGYILVISPREALQIYAYLPILPTCPPVPPTANIPTAPGRLILHFVQKMMIHYLYRMRTLHLCKAITIQEPASGPKKISTSKIQGTRQ